MLRGEGLEVRRAATGHEALTMLERQAFDAIFLDVRLPDISGQDVYARLAAVDPGKARRVIFVTGGTFTQRAREFLDSTSNDYVSKPYDAQEVRRMVSERLRR